jgi:hypothetical protein
MLGKLDEDFVQAAAEQAEQQDRPALDFFNRTEQTWSGG